MYILFTAHYSLDWLQAFINIFFGTADTQVEFKVFSWPGYQIKNADFMIINKVYSGLLVSK